MDSGDLFAWGTGCLGLSPDEDAVVAMVQTKTRIPRHVVMNVSVAMVAAGSGSGGSGSGGSGSGGSGSGSTMQHCLLLSVQGDVYAWGDGSRGQLGTFQIFKFVFFDFYYEHILTLLHLNFFLFFFPQLWNFVRVDASFDLQTQDLVM